MKAWLDRWRISRALDDGTPLSPALERRLRADPELSLHHEKLQALGRALGREARAWRETAGSERPEPRAELPLARAPRVAAPGPRARLRPVLLLVPSAAAAVLALLAVRALRPDADPSADMQRAAAAAHESGQATARASAGSGASRGLPATTPWSRLDGLAKRTSALSPSALGKSGEQALLQEARNVARDAAQVATHLAEHVPFARAEPR
jgi:hypothetical protein